MSGSDKGFKGIAALASELDIAALKASMSAEAKKTRQPAEEQLMNSPEALPRGKRTPRVPGASASASNSEPTRPDGVGIGVALICLVVVILMVYAIVVNKDESRGERESVAQFTQSYHVTAGTLNVRSAPSASSPVIAKLTNGQDVFASPKSSTQTQGWREVQFGETNGWVSTSYLKRGTAEEARVEKCKASATRPATGEIFNKNGDGPHTLVVKNGPNGDAIAKLKDTRGNEIISFYVRADETATVDGVPEGFFKFQFATGKYYSPSCGGNFMEGMRVSEDPDYAHYKTTNNGYARYSSIMEYTLTRVRSGNLNMESVPVEKF